jgi:hypothetical protein
MSPDDIDTVVVPAREDGFQDVFLGEDRWYSVRINETVQPQIKYIAAYQVAPVSAITHRKKNTLPKLTQKLTSTFGMGAVGGMPVPRYFGASISLKTLYLRRSRNLRGGMGRTSARIGALRKIPFGVLSFGLTLGSVGLWWNTKPGALALKPLTFPRYLSACREWKAA